MRNRLFSRALFGILFLVPLMFANQAIALDSTRTSFATTQITSRYITVPVGTIVEWPQTAALPTDADPKWRECDGRVVPTNSDLYKQKHMSRTPNLYAGKGYFLRASATPNRTFEDTLRSHNHEQPSHTHDWNGQLSSTAVSGTAKGQEYYDLHSTMNAKGYPTGYNPWPGSAEASAPSLAGFIKPYLTPESSHSHSAPNGSVGSAGNHTHEVRGTEVYWTPWYHTRNAKDSALYNTKVVNGTVNGTNAHAGDDPTYFTGEDETAPMHYSTRYFIRIND